MSSKQTIVVGFLLAFSLALNGCKKTKPPVPPPQAQAPTITDTNVPSTIPEVPVPQPTPEEPATKPAPTVTKKTKPRTRVETKKTPPATQPATPTTPADKVVIEEGSKQPDPGQPPLIANDGNSQSNQQRQNANQLLSAAEYNIRNISRPLSSTEQEQVQHIRGFIQQAREALKVGDDTMAYNLAVKAHLMSQTFSKQ